MSAALITVIIGAYNAERYLAEAIDSVLAQTHPRLELIVVDDGSTDGTGDVAEAYGDPVRCIRQENGGMAAARNRAVPEARGDYLAFLDADDRFPPDKLAGQLAVFEADPDLDVVYGHVTEFLSPDLDETARALPGTQAAALAALAPSTIFQLHPPAREALAQMAELVRTVPTFSLELGADVETIPGELLRLLEEVG